MFRSSLDGLVSLALGAARVRSCGSAKLEEQLGSYATEPGYGYVYDEAAVEQSSVFYV